MGGPPECGPVPCFLIISVAFFEVDWPFMKAVGFFEVVVTSCSPITAAPGLLDEVEEGRVELLLL